MKQYTFEYSDQSFLYKLLGICFLIMFLLFLSIGITNDLIGIGAGIAIAFVVPALTFWLNRKKIKQSGSATLHDTYCEFLVLKFPDRIDFADISKCKLNNYNSVSLVITLRSKKKVTLFANANFCNTDALEAFGVNFRHVVEQYQKKNS